MIGGLVFRAMYPWIAAIVTVLLCYHMNCTPSSSRAQFSYRHRQPIVCYSGNDRQMTAKRNANDLQLAVDCSDNNLCISDNNSDDGKCYSYEDETEADFYDFLTVNRTIEFYAADQLDFLQGILTLCQAHGVPTLDDSSIIPQGEGADPRPQIDWPAPAPPEPVDIYSIA